jgi:transcriptional regulator with XRE-family HTH domain
MSPQAVSKWEMGAGYPDIAILPVIAAYFGVSLDTLFDYDPEEIEEKIKNIRISVGRKRNFEDREKILLDGIAAYPGSDTLKIELLEDYAGQIRHGKSEYKNKALALGEKLLAESRDTLVTSAAKAHVADIYIATGNYEAGKKLIESMPYLYHLDIFDRMRCSSMFLKDEEKLHATRQWKVWTHQEMYMLCQSEGMDFFNLGNYENAIISFKEAIDTIELFMRREVPDEYRPLGGRMNQAFLMVRIAACLYKLGKCKECDAELDKSYHLFRSLLDSEVARLLTEEVVRRRLDTEVRVRELHGIEVHSDNLLLGIVMLELRSDDILLNLGHDGTRLALHALLLDTRLVEVFGQLLRHGTTTTLVLLTQEDGLDAHTRRSLKVDARVVEEAYILGSQECRNDGWQLMAINLHPALPVCGEELLV